MKKYSKEQLTNSLNEILGSEYVYVLGTSRAVEESAITIFMDSEKYKEQENIIRNALLDLRKFGIFKYSS